jgi:S-adenosylmethionine/arginine decarboxylase-like enzyme
MTEISGLHLLVDGTVRESRALEPANVMDMFDHLVEVLGMEYLQRPMAARVPLEPEKLVTGEDEGGWSVICQITTSHISLHGWPLRKAFMLDVFSCSPFDARLAKEVIWADLGVDRAAVKEITRKGPDFR